MTEQELEKQRNLAENIERLKRLRPIDDIFMRNLFRDNLPLAEYVLRIIIGKDDLKLTKEETQKDLVRLVGSRGLCLDVHGVDDQGQHYDLEVQRADAGARPERARYHAGALDVENLTASQEFEDLPTTYIIFITEKDIFKKGLALYPIQHINAGTGELFEDRQHVIYVNASYKGDDPLGRLMHDFLCSDPDEMYTPMMAEKSRLLKTDPEGVKKMYKTFDDMRKEDIQRGEESALLKSIKSIMENLEFTPQQAMDALNIPVTEQPKYQSKL